MIDLKYVFLLLVVFGFHGINGKFDPYADNGGTIVGACS